MGLKEYEFGDRTYLFDEDNVPKGAKLVSDKIVTPDPVRLFPDQIIGDNDDTPIENVAEADDEDESDESGDNEDNADPKQAKPANKAAKPANK